MLLNLQGVEMNKVFDEKVQNRVEMILDDLNNMFDSVAEMKASVLTVKYLLQADCEAAANANKPL